MDENETNNKSLPPHMLESENKNWNREDEDENGNQNKTGNQNANKSIVLGGKAISSSHLNASTVESKAFTGLQGNYWSSKELSDTKTKEKSIDEWIGYEFSAPKTVTKFSFKGDPVKELNGPASYTFEGSNDGKEWKILFNVEPNPGKDKGKEFKSVDEVRTHEVAHPEAFKFYRLHVTNNGNSKQGRGAHTICVSDFQMFE